MDHSAINVRYAKAFFSTAKEKKLLDELKADIQLVLDICTDSKEFILLLESPVVKISQKSEIIKQIFKGKVEELSLNFLLLITQNKREANIPGICRNFLDLTRKDQNVKTAILTTASEVNTKALQKVTQLLEKELNATIELKTRVNPDLLGGLVLRLEDKQYDASIATHLKRVKQSLLETEIK